MSAAVIQTFQILQLLADSPNGLGISEIATTLELNKQIPFRHLALLEQEGYVRKDARTDRYLLTYKLGSLGLRQIRSAGVDRWAQPTLDHLARDTGELSRLAIFEDGQLSWVAEAEPLNLVLRIDPARGSQAPLTTTASGRALLSLMPPGRARAIIQASKRVALNPFTLIDPEEIYARVEKARADGFAVVVDEREYGVSAVAAPIPTPTAADEPFGTVSISGPTARMTPETMRQFGERVAAAAAEVFELLPVHAFATRSVVQGDGILI